MTDITTINAQNVHTIIKVAKPVREKDAGGIHQCYKITCPLFVIPPCNHYYKHAQHQGPNGPFETRNFMVIPDDEISRNAVKSVEIIRAFLYETFLRISGNAPEGGLNLDEFKTDQIRGLGFYMKENKVTNYDKPGISVDLTQGVNKRGETYHSVISLRNGSTVPNTTHLDSIFEGKAFKISSVINIVSIKLYDVLEGTPTPKIATKTVNCVIFGKASGKGAEEVAKIAEQYADAGHDFGEEIGLADLGIEDSGSALPESHFAPQTQQKVYQPGKAISIKPSSNPSIANKLASMNIGGQNTGLASSPQPVEQSAAPFKPQLAQVPQELSYDMSSYQPHQINASAHTQQ